MITSEQLDLHAAWLRSESDGRRLFLSDADLRDADLRDSDLRNANLRDADLRGSNLEGADLRGSNLEGADLSGANLRDSDLRNADLRNADLRNANLRDSDLRDANLRDANLRDSDLRNADLRDADLSDSDLRDADLSDSDLRNADLRGAVGLAIATDADQRLRAVAEAALAEPEALQMNAWHTCDTTHCVSGWAIAQAGEPGRLLEAAVGSQIAGLMLLGTEAHSHFFDDDDTARAWLQEVLER